MTQDDIIRMAREAGFCHDINNGIYLCAPMHIERFAALVSDAEAKRIHDEGMVTVGHMREQIAAEREACAQTCEQAGIDGYGTLAAAALIRKRSEA